MTEQGPSRPVAAAYPWTSHKGVHTSLTAAAQVLSSKIVRTPATLPTQQRSGAGWQDDAWNLYDEVGELHYAASWLANALSRVRLVAARVSENGEPEPVEDGPAAEMVAGLTGGPADQEQFLKRIAHQLTITGESYIIGRTLPGQDEPTYWPYSSEEVSLAGGRWTLDDGTGPVVLSDDELVVRAWHPHPRRFTWPDTAVRAALPVLRELRGLTQHVSAQVDSRLAGAGVLMLPQGMTFPKPATADGDQPPGDLDSFMATLVDAMVTPIRDRDSAAAVVPIVVQAPDEALGKAQYLSFASQLDSGAKDLRDEAIRRTGLALDMPPEILLGLGDSNHWSAWAVDEASIRLSVAPLAAVVCHALTVGWLRPALADTDAAGADELLVWFDTTPLELRPDRSESAVALYDRAELSGEALRRENGFVDTDAPDEAERLRLLAARMVSQAPALAPTLAPLLGLPAPEAAPPEPSGGAGTGPAEAPGGGRELPGRGAAPPEAASMAPAGSPAELVACSLAVKRALELCGKRLMTRGRRSAYADVPAHELHTSIPFDRDPDELLAGAWDSLCDTLGAAACDRLTPVLDAYVRRLLNTRAPFTVEGLAAALDDARDPGPDGG